MANTATLPTSVVSAPDAAAGAREQGQRRGYQDATAYIGMVIFLGSWAIMFAALFFTYAGVRIGTPVWPPSEYPSLPLGLPWLNTAMIALSSFVLHRGIRAARAGRSRHLSAALLAATALGCAFLVSQLVVWLQLHHAGLAPSSGAYGSAFFGLTWVHAAHVLVGVLALAYLAIRSASGAAGRPLRISVRLWAMYWHFVGAVWAFLFVTVYLL